MLSDRRKQLVYLAAGLAACIVLVLAFADDSDYQALLAARAQKLSDDVKFDPGQNPITITSFVKQVHISFPVTPVHMSHGVVGRCLSSGLIWRAATRLEPGRKL